MTKEFKITIKPTIKQKEAWKYLKDEITRFIVFGGGCFSGDTLIRTKKGYKPISGIKKGELVMSYDGATKQLCFNRVKERFIYNIPTRCIRVKYKGEDIVVTENHKFLFNGRWVEIGDLCRRRVEEHQWLKPKVYDKQSGKNKIINAKKAIDNEPCQKLQRIPSYHDNNKWDTKQSNGSSVGSAAFHSQPHEQAASESQGLQQAEQPCFEFGMGNGSREFYSCKRAWFNEFIHGTLREWFQSKTSEGRTGKNKQTKREPDFGDKEQVQAKEVYTQNVGNGIWRERSNNKRYNSEKKLEAFEIELEGIESFDYIKADKVYDLEVDKTHNYVITKNNIIVHNSGGGKSWIGCEWLLISAIAYPGTKWYLARNELKRIMTSTYITFIKVCRHHHIPSIAWKLNSQYNYIELWNGSRIDLLDVSYKPSDPLYERFGSMEYTSGWLEEAGEIKGRAFEVLKSRIGRCKNEEYNLLPKMLLTCNPKKHWLYFDFYKKWKENKLPQDMKFIQSLYTDNPFTVQIYGEALEQIKDPVLKARLKEGKWDYEEDDAAMIDYDKILKMFMNRYEPKPDDEMYLTIDPARFGKDRAVFTLWQGFHIRKVWFYDKSAATFLEQKTNHIQEQFRIPRRNIAMDADGIGGPILDHLPGIYAFNNGASAVEEWDDEDKYREQPTDKFSFVNLRSQCYTRLATYINEEIITCSDEIEPQVKQWIIEDLEAIKKQDVEDNEKKFRVISKDKIKEIIGRSPDFGDSIMMRMVFALGELRETMSDMGDVTVVW